MKGPVGTALGFRLESYLNNHAYSLLKRNILLRWPTCMPKIKSCKPGVLSTLKLEAGHISDVGQALGAWPG